MNGKVDKQRNDLRYIQISMISKTIDALHKYADVPHTVVFESSRFNAEAVNGGNVAMLPRGRKRFICIYIYICIQKNISKSIRIYLYTLIHMYIQRTTSFLFLVYSYKTYLLRSYISIYIYTFRVFFFFFLIFHQIIFS